MRRLMWALFTSKIFLLALLLIIPLAGCSKKKSTSPPPPPPKDCWDPVLQRDTCKIYPRIKDNNAAWSPDGRSIAYFHGGFTQQGDTSGIYLIDTAGNSRRVLVPSVLAVQPAFSPDSQWVAFANLADGSIYKIKINGDSATRLTFGREDQEPDWSPDGEMILFSSRTGPNLGIWIMDKNGANQRFLLPYANTGDWLNDGIRFICGAFLQEQDSFIPYTVIFNRIDSTFKKLCRPSETTICGGYPRLSPDNSKILLTVGEPDNEVYVAPTYLYTMDTTGQNLQKLLFTLSTEGAWSPDGRRIVYTDTRPEYGTLFIMDADGRNKRQLTLTGLPKRSPGRQ